MITLVDQVKHVPRLWPTPAARDWRSPGYKASYHKRREKRQQALNEEAAWGEKSEKQGGQLNPEWVEWLMGFPSGWTDIEREGKLEYQAEEDGSWPEEPDIPRVIGRIPNRAARIKALGNAVVPVVAEFIGRAIISASEGADE